MRAPSFPLRWRDRRHGRHALWCPVWCLHRCIQRWGALLARDHALSTRAVHHALCSTGVIAFRFLYPLDLPQHRVPIHRVVALFDWRELDDPPILWHAQNVGHEALDERSVALVHRRSHLGRDGGDGEHVAWVEGAAERKAGAVVDFDHDGRVGACVSLREVVRQIRHKCEFVFDLLEPYVSI